MNRYIIQSLYQLAALLASFQLFGGELSERYPLIPYPVSLLPAEGTFTLDRHTKVAVHPHTADTLELAAFISDFLAAPLVKSEKITKEKGGITLIIDEKLGIAQEGYTLSVTPDHITIQASSTAGGFWAFQTLRQLLPSAIEQPRRGSEKPLLVPCVTISDAPRFGYRGLHLDVSRHMFPVEFIKKYIDLMASYKLNQFHWHLTDDQGWRIEIKKYPKLQEIAAYREETLIGHKKKPPNLFDGKRYGGYYTQEEAKEVVEYARKRHITVIPEIELPGHSVAALAADPDLGCTKGPYKTATSWGVYEDIYCAGSEKPFAFLEDVFTEILPLFPSKYIHIGGDEARKTRWKSCPKCQERIQKEGLKDEHELQSYFVRRIEKFLHAQGREIIGWDEILEGGLAPKATVMSWRGIDGGIEAARLHHDVVMTPQTYLYFDHYQSTPASEPLAIGGYTTLKTVYNYDPVPQVLTEQEKTYIIGTQANVWTEYIKTPEHVEYMTYPRALALAERSWSPVTLRDFTDFTIRLKGNLAHLDARDVHYAAHATEE